MREIVQKVEASLGLTSEALIFIIGIQGEKVYALQITYTENDEKEENYID